MYSGGGGGGGGGILYIFGWGVWDFKPLPYTRPCYHVQLILQPYTRLGTENPYLIPDLQLLELYKY